MTSIGPEEILKLLDEIENLKQLNGVGGMTNGKLSESRMNNLRTEVSGGAAEFDATRWLQLSGERQKELFQGLTSMHDELVHQSKLQTSQAINDKLPGDGVSNKAIIWLAIFGFIFAATLLSLIR